MLNVFKNFTHERRQEKEQKIRERPFQNCNDKSATHSISSLSQGDTFINILDVDKLWFCIDAMFNSNITTIILQKKKTGICLTRW